MLVLPLALSTRYGVSFRRRVGFQPQELFFSARQGTQDLKPRRPHFPFYYLSFNANHVLHHNSVLWHCNGERFEGRCDTWWHRSMQNPHYCPSGDPKFVQSSKTTSLFSVAIFCPNRTLFALVISSALTLTSSCVSCIPLAPSSPMSIGKGPPPKAMMGICTTNVN